MIKIGVVGFGNLGKSVVNEIEQYPDIELEVVLTRRNPKDLNIKSVKVDNISNVLYYKDKIDVLLLCGGSCKDLPEQAPQLLENFCIVDTFDTHAKIPQYFKTLDKIGKHNNKLSLIGAGWDPGLFSMVRSISSSVLPRGKEYTFWGKGISQGHSDAIRKIDGVVDARQYTIPKEQVLQDIRSGKVPNLRVQDKHRRECFVVVKNESMQTKIAQEIKNMPYYFADYDTVVHFVTQHELDKNHNKLYHGGVVFGTGGSCSGNKSIIEFSLKLDSNPDFTAHILLAFSRAVYFMHRSGKSGAVTALDIPLRYLSPLDYEKQLEKV